MGPKSPTPLLRLLLVQRPVLGVIIPLLSEWISTEDLARLDVAIGDVIVRKSFLFILSNKLFSTSGISERQVLTLQKTLCGDRNEYYKNLFDIYLEWLVLRGIKVQHMYLQPTSTRHVFGLEKYKSSLDLTKMKTLLILTKYKVDNSDKKERQTLSHKLHTTKATSYAFEEYKNGEENIMLNAKKILKILQISPKLTTLMIGSFDFSVPALEYELVGNNDSSSTSFQVFGRYPRLVTLDASCCKFMSDNVITSITSCCANLRYVNLSRNLLITDLAIASIVSHCPFIVDINIFGCKALTDKSIHAISTHCAALRTVNLRKCDNITDNSIVSLAENCHNLQNITLNDCKNISNVVRKVAEYRRNLLSMSIFNFFHKLSDESILKVAYCCPMLEAFKIGNCIDNSAISDVSVMKLASNCPLLRILHLERSGITDEALLKIATCCTQLKSLNVSDCSLTTVSAVQQLLELCPKIEHITSEYFEYRASDKMLKVSNSAKLTDSELYRIVRCIPELLHVNISNGESLQDISIIRIVDKYGSQLQSLSIAACEQLTDHSVAYALDHCSNLSSLDVGYNRCFSGIPFVDISDKAVRFSLRQIDISSCSISTEVIIQILRVCKRLKIVFINDKSIPFDDIRRIFSSRCQPHSAVSPLAPQQQSSCESKAEDEKEVAFSPSSPVVNKVRKNIFADLYSPVFVYSQQSPPIPLEVFNNSYFQFKRDGYVLKVIQYNISSESMLQILDIFPHLLCIDIQSPQTENLSIDTLIFIAEKYHDQLQSLAISKFGRHRVTDELTAMLILKCPTLKELKVNSHDLI
mmetsp:Transcript_20530/g.28293  ORF Transcript_20530/g.28293 Transcript_20530/m.28293 type:complete len:810 (+) Transcript_20530:78-2507(+)